jgi:hypothetical protein
MTFVVVIDSPDLDLVFVVACRKKTLFMSLPVLDPYVILPLELDLEYLADPQPGAPA